MTKLEITLTLNYLFEHHADFIREFLGDHGFKKSGTKAQLRERIEEALEANAIDPSELVALLDDISSWGNLQIFAFKVSPKATRAWRNEAFVKNVLRKQGAVSLFNRFKPLVLPEERTLSSITWSPNRVRIVWVEKREWEVRRPSGDIEKGDGIKVLKLFEKQHSRGILAFDWDLVKGEALLMIERLPTGSKYDQIKTDLLEEVSQFIDLGEFEEIPIGSAIKKLEHSPLARSRLIVHETEKGNKARFSSKSRKRDAFEDPLIRNSRSALGTATRGRLGNFYFISDDKNLDHEVHTVLNAEEQRVGIFGQHHEKEVRYVINVILKAVS